MANGSQYDLRWRFCIYMMLVGVLWTGGTGCNSFTQTRYPLLEPTKAMRQDHLVDLPRELVKTNHPHYVVEPGDGLLLLPTDLDSSVRLPADQTVLPDGTIDLGKYGRLEVSGRTIPEIELIVKDAIKKETPDAGFIDVRLVNRQSKQFYVIGELNAPGKFPLTGNETVLDAIMAAGGLNDKASWQNIVLVRPTNDCAGLILKVDFAAITQQGATATNYQIRAGDRVYVPTRGWREDRKPICK